MRRALALATIAVAAGVAAGCGGSDESSETSATVEWADGYCTAIATWRDSLLQTGADLADLSSLNQEGLDQAANDVRTSTQQLVDDLKSLGAPDTESGQEVKDAVDELAATLEADLTEIADTVEGISGLTDLPGAWTSIETALHSMAAAASSAFQAIEDADVEGELTDAIEQSDSCSELTSETN